MRASVRLTPDALTTDTLPGTEVARGEVVAALEPIRAQLESLNVDSIGVGWGIYLHLRGRDERLSVSRSYAHLFKPM